MLIPIRTVAQIQPIEISQRMLNESGSITLTQWRWNYGDNFSWLDSNYSTEEWEIGEPDFMAEDFKSEWNGIGWFKTTIQIDSSLIGIPIGLRFSNHPGASEVFLDGRRLLQIGEVSIFEEDVVESADLSAHYFVLNDTKTHSLGVRYSNFKVNEFIKWDVYPGFELEIINTENYADLIKNTQREKGILIGIIGFLIAFTLIHLSFLIFYPAGQNNLYYTFVAFGVTGFTVINNVSLLSQNPLWILYLSPFKYLVWFFLMVGLLRFAYSFQKKKTPFQLFIFLGASLVVASAGVFQWIEVNLIQNILSALFLIEFARVIFVEKFGKKTSVDLILWGLLIFGVIVWQNYESGSFFESNGFFFVQNKWAITVLIASISLYLLREFAKAQTKLEYKYLEVKHLSERSLDQERRNKEKEFQQKLLEAENVRKTAELEEARTLQLSMLPSHVPESKFWDIDAYMNTSQTVGGDYYDFNVSGDTLTVALGDATGHGMKAGIIVATAKSYFHSLAGNESIIQILKSMSRGIQNMDLRLLYMGITLLRCQEHRIKFTAAGMPPSLLYRKKTGMVEQVLLKAMPLGTKVDFPYQEIDLKLESGDVLVLLSDGLMELWNPEREQLGLKRIEACLIDHAYKSATGMIDRIKALQNEWSATSDQEDDVTVMIMKAK